MNVIGYCNINSSLVFALYLLGIFLTGGKKKKKDTMSGILENMENLSRAFGAKEVAQKNGSSQKFGVLATGSSGTIHIHHSGICIYCLIFQAAWNRKLGNI